MPNSTELLASHDRSGYDAGRTMKHEELAIGAALCWLGVAIFGVAEIAGQDSEWPYALFAIVLLTGAALTIATAWACTRGSDRGALRKIGLGLGAVAIASTVIAWALPLWMTTIGAALVVLTFAAPRECRPGLAAVAAGQIIGMGVLFGAITAEVGPRNSYGDYPAAFGIGMVVTAVGSFLGLVLLSRVSAPSSGSTGVVGMRK